MYRTGVERVRKNHRAMEGGSGHSLMTNINGGVKANKMTKTGERGPPTAEARRGHNPDMTPPMRMEALEEAHSEARKQLQGVAHAVRDQEHRTPEGATHVTLRGTGTP